MQTLTKYCLFILAILATCFSAPQPPLPKAQLNCCNESVTITNGVLTISDEGGTVSVDLPDDGDFTYDGTNLVHVSSVGETQTVAFGVSSVTNAAGDTIVTVSMGGTEFVHTNKACCGVLTVDGDDLIYDPDGPDGPLPPESVAAPTDLITAVTNQQNGIVTYTHTAVDGKVVSWQECCPDPTITMPGGVDVTDPVAVDAYLGTLNVNAGTIVQYIGSDGVVHVTWTVDQNGDWAQAGAICNLCDVEVDMLTASLLVQTSQFGVVSTNLVYTGPQPPFPDLNANGNLGPTDFEWDVDNQVWYPDCCAAPLSAAILSNNVGILEKQLMCTESDGEPFGALDQARFKISQGGGTLYDSGLVSWGSTGIFVVGTATGSWDFSVFPGTVTFDMNAHEADEGISNGVFLVACTCRNQDDLESTTFDIVQNGTAGPLLELDSTSGGAPGEDPDEAELIPPTSATAQDTTFSGLLRLYEDDGSTPLDVGCSGEITVSVDCGVYGSGVYTFPLGVADFTGANIISDDPGKPWATIDPYFSGGSVDGSTWLFNKQQWKYQGPNTTNAGVDVVFSAQINVTGNCGMIAGASNQDLISMPCYTFVTYDNNFFGQNVGGFLQVNGNVGVGGFCVSSTNNIPFVNIANQVSVPPTITFTSGSTGWEWYQAQYSGGPIIPVGPCPMSFTTSGNPQIYNAVCFPTVLTFGGLNPNSWPPPTPSGLDANPCGLTFGGAYISVGPLKKSEPLIESAWVRQTGDNTQFLKLCMVTSTCYDF